MFFVSRCSKTQLPYPKIDLLGVALLALGLRPLISLGVPALFPPLTTNLKYIYINNLHSNDWDPRRYDVCTV